MAVLRQVFEGLGYTAVETFIASGNVIFEAQDDAGTTARIESALEEELGFEVPTFLRTAAEVIDVADADVFGDSSSVEVSFLRAAPDAAAARALEATATGADRLAVIGREVYWGHSGDRALSTHSEGRVMRLLDMPTTQRSMGTVQRLAQTHLR